MVKAPWGGGYVTLTQNSEVVKGIITNYHVVQPTPTDENATVLQNLDRYGRLGADPIQIELLAHKDRDASLAQVNMMLDGIQNRIQGYDNTIKERELIGARALPKLMEMLDINREALSPLLEKRRKFENTPYLLGEVVATSGKTLLGKRVIDWAFVRLGDEAAKFFEPNKMSPAPEEHLPERYEPNFELLLPKGRPLTEFGTLEKGAYYVKNGRSTGVTGGICHGTLACY